MALDRTWYNTLVNDDGSGLTGSVWDKEDVNQLMNAIDAQLASPFVTGFPWVDYTPQLNSSQGVVFSNGGAYARYQQSGQGGKTVTLQYSIEALSFSFSTTDFWIALPLPAAGWTGSATVMATSPLFISGAYETGQLAIVPGDPYYVRIARMGVQNFPAQAGIYVRGTFIYKAQ